MFYIEMIENISHKSYCSCLDFCTCKGYGILVNILIWILGRNPRGDEIPNSVGHRFQFSYSKVDMLLLSSTECLLIAILTRNLIIINASSCCLLLLFFTDSDWYYLRE